MIHAPKGDKRVTPVAQEPHTAADCKINESPHNNPEVDCGHYVEGNGPHLKAEADAAAGLGHKPGETIDLGPGGTRCPGVTEQDLRHEGPAFMGEGPGPGNQ